MFPFTTLHIHLQPSQQPSLPSQLLPLRLKQWEAADGGEADGCLAMETAERRREKVEKRGSQDPEADPEQDPAAFFM